MEFQPQSQPQNGSPMPTRATMQDIQALLDGPALSHLAPVAGGRWQLLSRADDTVLVMYVLNDGTQVMTTTVHLAVEASAAANICWQYVYSFPADCNPDDAWPDETPQAQSTIIPNVQMAPSAPVYYPPGNANNTWPANATVYQNGGVPVSVNAQLPASYQPINQHHPGQAPVATTMGPFQSPQPMNTAETQPGDVSVFQNGGNPVLGPGPFVLQNENVETLNTDPHWSSFAGNL